LCSGWASKGRELEGDASFCVRFALTKVQEDQGRFPNFNGSGFVVDNDATVRFRAYSQTSAEHAKQTRTLIERDEQGNPVERRLPVQKSFRPALSAGTFNTPTVVKGYQKEEGGTCAGGSFHRSYRFSDSARLVGEIKLENFGNQRGSSMNIHSLEDISQMDFDRVLLNQQLFRDFAIGQTSHEQFGHLLLPLGQPTGGESSAKNVFARNIFLFLKLLLLKSVHYSPQDNLPDVLLTRLLASSPIVWPESLVITALGVPTFVPH
jgi:hypothetical protein